MWHCNVLRVVHAAVDVVDIMDVALQCYACGACCCGCDGYHGRGACPEPLSTLLAPPVILCSVWGLGHAALLCHALEWQTEQAVKVCS